MPRVTRRTTDELEQLDIRSLARAARRAGVELDGQLDLGAERVQLCWSRMPTGSRRPWVRCPECAGRVGVLYLDAPGLRCRRCADLAYLSTRQDDAERALDQAIARRTRARAALGAGPGALDPIPPRPPRARAWERRLEDLRRAEAEVHAAVGAIVAGMRARAEAWIAAAESPARPAQPPRSRTPRARSAAA